MTAAEDLACRYLALWQEYVTVLLTDLMLPETAQQRAAAPAPSVGDHGQGEKAMFGQLGAPQPAAGPATVAGSPRGRNDDVADLARRLASVEERVAALERGKPAATRPGGGNRGIRR